MKDYGAITTGAGVETAFNSNFVHEYLEIGTIDADPDIRGINITVGGDVKQRISLANANIMGALGNIIAREIGSVNPVDGVLSYIFPVADGFNPNANLELSIINNGAGTPQVRGFSTKKGKGRYVKSGMETIQASDSIQYMNDFDYLLFEDNNFDYADITFADGHSEGNMDEEALRAMLATRGAIIDTVASADVIAIDNTANEIAQITIYSTSGGTMTIVRVNAPS